MQKATSLEVAFLLLTCLTMSYFHGRMPTIIGAKAFHGPVRDGKEWFHLAIVVRHNWLAGGRAGDAAPMQQPAQLGSRSTCDYVNRRLEFVLMRTKRRFIEQQT